MPDMFEIYQRHAPRYHELVMAEDHQNNLGTLLHQIVDWHDLSVLEAGVGTGRVTQLYIADAYEVVCCDQSPHILEFAQKNLVDHSSKLTYHLADNEKLPDLDSVFDVFIEGWSFGHSIMACDSVVEILHTINVLLANVTKNLSPGSTMILIETMGTNTDSAAPPHENLGFFYDTLVNKHGFSQHTIRTDYQFSTNEAAVDIMSFFFGDEMKQSVLARGTSMIPEWTGVWVKEI